MLLTKEMIQERLNALQAQEEQLKINLQVTNGALQDCKYWLSIIDTEEIPLVLADA